MCVPENEWKRPTVNMAIWKKRQEKEGGRGEERRREEDVMFTTAALWRVGSRRESKHVWCTAPPPTLLLLQTHMHTHTPLKNSSSGVTYVSSFTLLLFSSDWHSALPSMCRNTRTEERQW